MLYILVALIGILVGAIIRGLLLRGGMRAVFLTKENYTFVTDGTRGYRNTDVFIASDGVVCILNNDNTKEMSALDMMNELESEKDFKNNLK